MNNLSAQQWNNLLYKFVSNEDYRPVIQKPFEQDDFICATDAHIVLRVNKSLIPESGYDYTPKGKPPNVAKVMPSPDPTFTITAKALKECFVMLGLDYDMTKITCPECRGEGMVSWKYQDRDGDTHTMDAECPCCDGTGEAPNGEGCYCRIGDRIILAHFMILVHQTMETLGVNTIKCTKDSGSLLLNLNDGVDILVVTQPADNAKKNAPVKTTRIKARQPPLANE